MQAILTLGRLGARDAVPELIGLLDDWRCRLPAADALAAIGDRTALAPLQEVADRDVLWRRRHLRRRVAELEAADSPG